MLERLNISMGKLSWSRPLRSYQKIQRIYSWFIRGKRFQLRKLSGRKNQYLNVGCGPNSHPNFVNLDFFWRPNIELCWDINKGIPLETNSIKGIFSEHCLEHISYSQCLDVLKEFHRVVRPNGIVRLVLPDAELYFDLYSREKRGEFVEFPYADESMVGTEFTPIMAINRVFRNHGHQFAYDARTLELMLRQVGFCDIHKVSYMTGKDNGLLIDSEKRKIESLYIEASSNKPDL